MFPCKSRSPRGHHVLVALVVLVVVLTGCRTTIDVAVEMSENGSGTVTVTAELDSEAAAALGGPERLALDDIAQSGWELTEPAVEEDGSFSIVATHGFADSGELQSALEDIAGESVFSAVVAEVEQSFARTTHELSVDVAVTGDPAQFSDDALTELLGGFALGRSPEQLAAEGVQEPGAGTLTVSVAVQGGESDSAVLDLTSGESQQVAVAVESTESRPLVLAATLGGATLVVLALVLAVVALFRRRRG